MLPEAGEIIASYEHLVHVLKWLAFYDHNSYDNTTNSYADSETGWPLKAIYADCTKDERRDWVGTDERMDAALPVEMRPDLDMPRGNANDRGTVWPLDFPDLDGFVFRNVYMHSRSLVLDFTVCFLDMHYLLHTSLQLFPKEMWEERVMDVPVTDEARNFKIVIALVFEDYTLAFLSKDLLAKPSWTREPPEASPEIFPGWNVNPTSDDELPVPDDWWTLQAKMVDACFQPKFKNMHTLALKALRLPEWAIYYPGMGVFTVIEVWFRAGLPPWITLVEFVRDESRFARFAEAYYAFVHLCKKDYWPDVIRPALHNYTRPGFIAINTTNPNVVLSPTIKQRLQWASQYLHVFSKPVVKVFPRHAKLINDYENWVKPGNRLSKAPPEPYEPTYSAIAFRKRQHLAHLIWGKNSPMLSHFRPSPQVDPITMAYKRRSGLNAFFKKETNVPICIPPFLPFQSRSVKRKVYYFPSDTTKTPTEAWSVVPPMTRRNGDLFPKDVWQRATFAYIICVSKDVSIGPLEYVGYAGAVNTGKTIEVATMRGDRSLLEGSAAYATIRNLVGQARKALQLPCDQPGGSKLKLTPAEVEAIDAGACKLMEDRGWKGFTSLIDALRNGTFKEVLENFRNAEDADGCAMLIPHLYGFDEDGMPIDLERDELEPITSSSSSSYPAAELKPETETIVYPAPAPGQSGGSSSSACASSAALLRPPPLKRKRCSADKQLVLATEDDQLRREHGSRPRLRARPAP